MSATAAESPSRCGAGSNKTGDDRPIERIANAQPGGRIARPDEQAQAAVWLCSDRASFITRVALPIDNGATLGATVDLTRILGAE